jgi:hypothetical protein
MDPPWGMNSGPKSLSDDLQIPDLFSMMLEGVQTQLPHGQQLTRFAVMTRRYDFIATQTAK